ncbi:MAG: choice-of-anchor D domain-containing protein, partial [Wenzhouxiangella sp.]
VTGDTCTPVNTGGDQWLAENIVEDCAVEANFLINTYTVAASAASGEGSITPPSQLVDHGSDATFTVTPATGWSLDSVVGDTCTPGNTGADQWLAENIVEDCAVEASFLINTYTLGGTVSGLEGSGLVLSLDDVETLSIAASGAFTFLAELDHGTAWSVSVETQPAGPAQTCSVSNGSSPGITGDVDNISVVCSTDAFEISGTIAGLTASGLVLNLNGSESLPLGAGSTSFQFADAVADGSDYLVRVETQPDGQWCEVSDGQGTVSGGPVEDVRVSCSDVGISLSLTDINFGFVILGVKETRGFTVSNPGTNPLIISGITSPGSPFSIISNSCSPLPRTLNAGESCMVAIELDSGTLGDFEAEILITSNAQDSPQAVTVRGAIISPLAVPLLSPLALLLLILMLLVAARVRIRSRQKA